MRAAAIRPMLLAPLLAPLLMLTACDEAATPAPEPAPPPVLAGVDLSQPVRVLGTEPFWAIEITPQALTWSGVDRPEQTAPNPGPTLQGTLAVIETRTAQGQALKVTLMATDCSDGMSDRTYPLTARVTLGEETLSGCAASVEALARAGESGRVE